MSRKDEKETQHNPDGGLLDDIKQKTEEMISQAGSFFDQPKHKDKKKNKFKKNTIRMMMVNLRIKKTTTMTTIIKGFYTNLPKSERRKSALKILSKIWQQSQIWRLRYNLTNNGKDTEQVNLFIVIKNVWILNWEQSDVTPLPLKFQLSFKKLLFIT